MRARALALAVALTVSLGAAAVAQAAPPLEASIANTGKLVNQGQAADIRVTVLCGSGYRLLEAFAYITQNGNTSQFTGIPVVCDGHRRTYLVRIRAFEDAPFHTGRARASAFVLVEHGHDTQSVSPSAEIVLRY